MCSVVIETWEDKLGPQFFSVEPIITMYTKVKVCNMDRHWYNWAFVFIHNLKETVLNIIDYHAQRKFS